jgi:hypothetical protein
MSESVKAAQTLVWRAGRGGADKPTQFATLPAGEIRLLLGEKDVSRWSVPLGYQGWTIYIRILIPFARYRRYIGRRSTPPQGMDRSDDRATWPTISQFEFWLVTVPGCLRS